MLEETIRFPRTGATGSYELLDMRWRSEFGSADRTTRALKQFNQLHTYFLKYRNLNLYKEIGTQNVFGHLQIGLFFFSSDDLSGTSVRGKLLLEWVSVSVTTGSGHDAMIHCMPSTQNAHFLSSC